MMDVNDYWREQLRRKKVIVTGGSTGIGREITILLAKFGAQCFICGRNQEQIDETIEAVITEAADGSCTGIVADVSSQSDLENLFAAADSELGGLDILVNNAALGYGSIMEGSYEDWEYIVKTNLLSYMACSNYAARRMEGSRRGQIVNIGSMSADVREEGSSVYVATKAGIQGFSEALRKELNPKGIKVILIEPGATDTDMQDGTADEKNEKVDNEEMLKARDIAFMVLSALIQPERCDIVSVQIRPHLQLI